jgi:Domain of unknown function (DUF4190)
MSEFKFPCPACGQDVLCELAHVGKEITCPICHASIIVPEATVAPADGSTQTDAPSPWTGYNGTTAQRTSGLAIASLVCSLLSLVTCIGWLPGIICGHLAKSRIRRDSSLKGRRLATAGLVIGYSILMFETGTAAVYLWRFSAAVKHGYENARQDLATNPVIITQIQTTTVSNENPQMEPVKPVAVVADNPQTESAKDEWTADINNVSFPDHPASGKIHGTDFAVRSALFRNGSLRISSANGASVDIFRLADSIAGQSYEIQSTDDDDANPRVRMTWNEGDVIRSATFRKGYALKLQFGQAKNRRASAKIYLCFPDNSKSCVAGALEVRLAKQQ